MYCKLKRSFILSDVWAVGNQPIVDDLIALLFFVDLHLELVDYRQQVHLHHVVLEFVILVYELLLHTLDVNLGLEEFAVGSVLLEFLE